MRLLIKRESLKDCVYDIVYYPKMQGFVYSLLKGTEYSSLHDSRSYKFFSFSNIFPVENFRSGDERRFMISSPDEKLIETLKNKIANIEKVAIGEMLFKIKDVAALNPKIASSCPLKTGTPIVIRIPKGNYAKYGISPPKKTMTISTGKRSTPLTLFSASSRTTFSRSTAISTPLLWSSSRFSSSSNS